MTRHGRLLLPYLLTLFALAFACQVRGQHILEFGGAGCVYCKQMQPVVDGLKASGVDVRYVDCEREPQLAAQFRVGGLPTFVALDKDRREVGRIMGATSAANLKALWAKTQAQGFESSRPQTTWNDPRIVKLRQPSNGGYSFGSGSVVSIDGSASYVLSCAHLVDGMGDEVRVYYHDGTSEVANVVAYDKPNDCTLIKLSGPRKQFFVLATGEPTNGQKVFTGGFPKAGEYRWRDASWIDFNSDVGCVSGGAIQGESGGPITNEKGEVVAVLHSTDGTVTYCCRLPRIRNLIRGIVGLPPLGQRPQQQPQGGIPGLQPPPLEPQAEAEDPATKPDQPTPDIDWEAWRSDMEDRLNQKQDRGDYATKDEIPDVSGFALKSDVPKLEGYAKKAELPDLSAYAKSESVNGDIVSLAGAVGGVRKRLEEVAKDRVNVFSGLSAGKLAAGALGLTGLPAIGMIAAGWFVTRKVKKLVSGVGGAPAQQPFLHDPAVINPGPVIVP